MEYSSQCFIKKCVKLIIVIKTLKATLYISLLCSFKPKEEWILISLSNLLNNGKPIHLHFKQLLENVFQFSSASSLLQKQVLIFRMLKVLIILLFAAMSCFIQFAKMRNYTHYISKFRRWVRSGRKMLNLQTKLQ